MNVSIRTRYFISLILGPFAMCAYGASMAQSNPKRSAFNVTVTALAQRVKNSKPLSLQQADTIVAKLMRVATVYEVRIWPHNDVGAAGPRDVTFIDISFTTAPCVRWVTLRKLFPFRTVPVTDSGTFGGGKTQYDHVTDIGNGYIAVKTNNDTKPQGGNCVTGVAVSFKPMR